MSCSADGGRDCRSFLRGTARGGRGYARRDWVHALCGTGLRDLGAGWSEVQPSDPGSDEETDGDDGENGQGSENEGPRFIAGTIRGWRDRWRKLRRGDFGPKELGCSDLGRKKAGIGLAL